MACDLTALAMAVWNKTRHGSTQQLGEEQWDNTTQLLLVPLLGTHQSTPTNVHSRLGAQHLKPTVG